MDNDQFQNLMSQLFVIGQSLAQIRRKLGSIDQKLGGEYAACSAEHTINVDLSEDIDIDLAGPLTDLLVDPGGEANDDDDAG